jgi:hypothetical protein
MEINLQSGSPEARRANELARELITERATDEGTEIEPGYGSLVQFSATLTRVLNEVLAGAPIEEAAWRRIAALTAALSMIAGIMATAYANEMAEIRDVDRKQSLEDVLQVTFRVLAEREESL